jgi:hypothetical protein
MEPTARGESNPTSKPTPTRFVFFTIVFKKRSRQLGLGGQGRQHHRRGAARQSNRLTIEAVALPHAGLVITQGSKGIYPNDAPCPRPVTRNPSSIQGQILAAIRRAYSMWGRADKIRVWAGICTARFGNLKPATFSNTRITTSRPLVSPWRR